MNAQGITSGSPLYCFSLTDGTAAGSSDFPDFADDKLLSYLTDNRIKPHFWTAFDSPLFYVEDGNNIDFLPITEKSCPFIGLAGQFADREPSDTW
jgi:hypothetical protein